MERLIFGDAALTSHPMPLLFKKHHDRKMQAKKIFTAYCHLAVGLHKPMFLPSIFLSLFLNNIEIE